MKKVLTIAAVVALTASFTSCRKDYTCDCSDDIYDTELPNYTKSAAENTCGSIDTSEKALGGSGCILY